MTYKLFIDDERFPPSDGEEWTICRTLAEVQVAVATKGWPKFVSFDHDLGEHEPTGFDIAKWMIEEDLDHGVMLPQWSFYIHSQNPVGAKNIQSILDNYLRVREA